MLENWLSPLDHKTYTPAKKYTRTQIGRKILFYWDKVPNLERVDIAIIGLDQEEADAIRHQLYPLEFPFRSLRVADLGNIRNKNHSFLIPVIKELLDGDILPIILGRDIEHSLAQYQSYRLKKYVNLVTIDEKIRWKTNAKNITSTDYINTIFEKKQPKLFNLGILGYQKHFTSQRVLHDLAENFHETVRVGEIRNDMPEIEPLIRYADLLTFNISALKSMEAPAQPNPSPSGLFSEEACQICRYAGISDRLTSIGFYGYYAEKDKDQLTAKTIAQLLWYFIEGYKSRKNDYPASSNELMEYLVENKIHSAPIRFWKSNKTGRWWIEVPMKSSSKKRSKTEMVPCSYEDYKLACQGELSNRVVRAYEKLA